MDKNWEEALFQQLTSLQENNDGVIDINNVDEIIKRFLEVISPYLASKEKQDIYHQIEMISAQFVALKRDISNISDQILDKNFIPDINMDLRSVVLQTEKSVTGILDVSDEISSICAKIQDPKIKEELLIKSTRILELCNFQDLTGQRIQKIIHHLGEIESIMYKMLHALRPDAKLKNRVIASETDLLNGPQKEEFSPSQEDIDNLFDKI